MREYARGGGGAARAQRSETAGEMARMGKMGKMATDFDGGGIAYCRKGETAQMVR